MGTGASTPATKLKSPGPGLKGGIAQNAVVTNRPFDHLSYRAVSLEWLANTFLNEHPTIEKQRLSVQKVVDDIIRKETDAKELRCSYVDKMLWNSKDGLDIVSRGRHFFYVNCSWDKSFAELVRALFNEFSPDKQCVWRAGLPVLPTSDVFVFIDALAENHHEPRAPNLTGLLRLHTELICDADYTLLVLDKKDVAVQNYPTLVFECLDGKQQSHVHIVPAGLDVMMDLQARQRVLDIEERSKLPAEVRAQVTTPAGSDPSQLADFNAVLTTSNLYSKSDVTERDSQLLLRELDDVVQVMTAFHFYAKAEKFALRALQMREAALGPSSTETLVSVVTLANVLNKLGPTRAAEAKKLYERALSRPGRQAGRIGAGRPCTLRSHAQRDQGNGIAFDDFSQLGRVMNNVDDLLVKQKGVHTDAQVLRDHVKEEIDATDDEATKAALAGILSKMDEDGCIAEDANKDELKALLRKVGKLLRKRDAAHARHKARPRAHRRY